MRLACSLSLLLVPACFSPDLDAVTDSEGSSSTAGSSTAAMSGEEDSTAADPTSPGSTSSDPPATSDSTGAATNAVDSTGAPPSCADSCDGCCDGETCLDGTNDEACGAGGLACAGCGVGFPCAAGECALDPGHPWQVRAISASVLNGPYDLGGPGSCGSVSTDPFLVMTLAGGENATTPVAPQTESPVWDALLLEVPATALLGAPLTVEVLDDDGMGTCSPPDPIGMCEHTLSEADLVAGGFVIAMCTPNLADITFELAPV